MKLYSDIDGTAPSPRRVRMFAAEKDFELQIIKIKIHEDNRNDDFAQKNPMRTLPVLELDDGTCISETVAICRYIEGLKPTPSLFGTTNLESATIEMWNRRSEFAFYLPIEFAGGFLGEKVAEGARRQIQRTAQLFDQQLSQSDYLAGSTISIADITTKVAIDFGRKFNDIDIDRTCEHFLGWEERMQSHDSFYA